MAGGLLLLILFQGSADFSENISAGKYSGYKEYQKTVGRFLPKLF
jgi:steroid 5-alpha reductase family enzyme